MSSSENLGSVRQPKDILEDPVDWNSSLPSIHPSVVFVQYIARECGGKFHEHKTGVVRDTDLVDWPKGLHGLIWTSLWAEIIRQIKQFIYHNQGLDHVELHVHPVPD